MSFERWMFLVNAILRDMYGITSEDLADCCYRDWWEDDIPPRQAAKMAITEQY